MWIYIWLAVACVSALIEAFTMQMVSIWFVAGGLIALILAICNVAIEIQIIVFIVVSLLAMISLRRICLKYLLRNTNTKTNVDSFQGKETRLLKTIAPDEPGEIKFADITWTAVAENGDLVIEKGSIVHVIRVDGNKMVVSPVEKASMQEANGKDSLKTEVVEAEAQKVEENKTQKSTKKTNTKNKNEKSDKE